MRSKSIFVSKDCIFGDEASVDFCYHHAVNMRKEAKLKRYIPPQFKDRSKQLYNKEYKYRRPAAGETIYKTRVKFGISDLILMIKTESEEERNWAYINIDQLELPPIDLSCTTYSNLSAV